MTTLTENVHSIKWFKHNLVDYKNEKRNDEKIDGEGAFETNEM